MSMAADIHPIFVPDAWRLTDQEAELADRARRLGAEKFAGRAEKWDRDAVFPTENYRDMHEAGLLGICIPREHGGEGGGFRAYCLAAAEIGRFCGSTALTLKHACLLDTLDGHAGRRSGHVAGAAFATSSRSRDALRADIPRQGAIYSQPFSEGGCGGSRFPAIQHSGARG